MSAAVPAIEIPSEASAALGAGDLAELLRAFNEVTAKLQSTQETLRSEVSRLQGELTEANQRLRRSRELAALGEMAAGIAHEIRNPLGSISLYAEALEEDLQDPSCKGLAGKIVSAVSGLNRVVGDVLDFSRDMRAGASPVDAEALLLGAADEARRELLDAGAEVAIECEPDLAAPCDADAMRRALVNLARNAAEAVRECDAPRRVRMSASRGSRRDVDGKRAPCATLAVEDSGAGIPEDVLPRMFNPFFTTRAAGTGLGLAIVHRIVDAHGGAVEVGRSPLGGARVALLLPLDRERSLKPAPMPAAESLAESTAESTGAPIGRADLPENE